MKCKDIIATIKRWGKRFADLQENGSPIKPMTFETMTCKHCGTTYQGNYCPRCGQSRVVSQITKRGFVSAFMEAYPQLASTFFRTILQLLYRPGYMIRDYFHGHRVIYSGPFKTFIVIVSIYVLCMTIIGGTGRSQNNFLNFEVSNVAPHTELAQKIAKPSGKVATILNKINHIKSVETEVSHERWIGPLWTMLKKKTQEQGALYLFFCVPLLAWAAKRAFRKSNFDGRQIIYAEHFMIFTYLYAINICFSLLYFLIHILASGKGSETYPTAIILFYLVWTYKGIYGWKWKEALRQAIHLAAWALLFFTIASIIGIALLTVLYLIA